MIRLPFLLFTLGAFSCAGDHAAVRTGDAESPVARDVASAAPPASSDAASASAAPASSSAPAQPTAPKLAFIDWVRSKLPKGGVATEENGKVTVTHTVQAKESIQAIAKEYLDLTDIYLWDDLMMELSKQGAVFPGKKIKIPHLVTEAYKSPDEERWTWPADKALRGIYLGGIYAVHPLQLTLERMQARNINAIVLDGKDYMGPITYPTKVQIAIDNGAAAHPPIADLSRTIRFAHKYGVYVIMRISCFHDPWTSVKTPKLSIQSKFGKAYPIDWLDPANPDAQQYILDLEEEEIELGADEIQLDYVRFPVQKGLGNAVLPPADGSREKVLTAFVHKAHEISQKHHVPLSLDIFGVTTTGTIVDTHNLGQDIGMLGKEAEALSPMVYPSHYDKGFLGFEEPGNHPEIISIGTRSGVHRLEKAGDKDVIVRPWLQAFMWKSPEYGPKYLAQETKEAEKGGGVGWLMWNPGCSYWDAWKALPPVPKSQQQQARWPDSASGGATAAAERAK